MHDWTDDDWATATTEFVTTVRWCSTIVKDERVAAVRALGKMHAACDTELAVPRSTEWGLMSAWKKAAPDTTRAVDWLDVRAAWTQVCRCLVAAPFVVLASHTERATSCGTADAVDAPDWARGRHYAVACGVGVANTRGLEFVSEEHGLVLRTTSGWTRPDDDTVADAGVREGETPSHVDDTNDAPWGHTDDGDGASVWRWSEALLACAEAPLSTHQIDKWVSRVDNDVRLTVLGKRLRGLFEQRDAPECDRLLAHRMRPLKRHRVTPSTSVSRGGCNFLDELCSGMRSLHDWGRVPE